jgi:hypothetical protein
MKNVRFDEILENGTEFEEIANNIEQKTGLDFKCLWNHEGHPANCYEPGKVSENCRGCDFFAEDS